MKLSNASPNAPGIELQVTTNVLQKEQKDYLLQLHPERKEIMKNVLEGISSFIEPILENPAIKAKWDLAQRILNLEYPTEYRHILELYKIASTNSIGTTYLSKLKETPPPEDLTDKAKVYSSLTSLSQNLNQLKQTIEKDLEEIKEQKIGDYEGHLKILKNSIEGCCLYLNPVLDQLTARSLTENVDEIGEQSSPPTEAQHSYKEAKISGDSDTHTANGSHIEG